MKITCSLFALAVAALFLATLSVEVGTAEAAAPKSYQLRCRGGNNVALTYLLDLPSGSANISADTLLSKYEIRLMFQKANVKGTEAIPEGTCAWMDRPFNSLEQARLRWLKAPFPTQVSLYPKLWKYGTTKVGYIHNAASAEKWIEYKDKLGKSTEYFDFWGYWQSPWLYITKVGP